MIRGAVCRMALRNLMRKRARTALAVVGLAVALILVVGLISFSYGVRDLVDRTLRQVQGLLVVQRDAPHLVLSRLPAGMEAELSELPGVEQVLAEVWHAAITLDGQLLINRKGLENPGLGVRGVDLAAEAALPRGGLFRPALLEGRYLEAGERDGVLLSRTLSAQLERPIGSTIRLPGADPLTVVGVYETGSMILDTTVLAPIEQVRKMKGTDTDTVSCYYLHLADAGTREQLAERINEGQDQAIRAFSPEEISETASTMLDKLDTMLLVIIVLPLVGAAAAVLNTMMMSFSERIVEFGVLKACGWRRVDVLGLVLVEALMIGLVGGVAGCAFGAGATAVVGAYLAVKPVTPAWLYAACLGLSLGLGAAGGLWPAARAALLPPIEAIRRG